jgi:multimeric flavodoxin WrbA
MVRAVLERTGKETDFVNLSKLRFDPCRGCCHLCAPTLMCGVKDDLLPWLHKLRDAEALVLGTPYQLGMPTGFMFNFLTRLECFRHVVPALYNKPAVLVSAGIKKYELQVDSSIPRFETMATHGKQIKLLGHIYYNSQSPPCLHCGEGQHCKYGGYWKYVIEKDENKLENIEVSTDLIQHWEDNPRIVEQINLYGTKLKEL